MTFSLFSPALLHCTGKWMNNRLIRIPESSGLRIQVNECSEIQRRWERRESHINYSFRIYLTSGSWCLLCYWPSASFPETAISKNLEENVTTQSELNVKNKQFVVRETNRCYHTVSGFSFTQTPRWNAKTLFVSYPLLFWGSATHEVLFFLINVRSYFGLLLDSFS